MKSTTIATSAFLVVISSGAFAADMRVTEAPPPAFGWAGLYLGGHIGGALDQSDIANPFGSTLFGDEVRSPGALAGIQIGYNMQFGPIVVGPEVDFSWADLDGTFTCLQAAHRSVDAGSLGGTFGATCQVQADRLGSLTGRIGTPLGPDDRILLYGKGGLAWMHTDIEMVTNNGFPGQYGPPNATGAASFTQWGWTVGAGVEYALDGNWSARLEYDFLRFDRHDVATPQARPIANPGFSGIAGSSAPDGRTAGIGQDVHALKLGVNYRFGAPAAPWPSEWSAAEIAQPPMRGGPSLEVEVGTRYVHGWGRFQQDLGGTAPLPANISRLTWDDLETDGAEVFWRVDAPNRLMVKGFAGLGNGDRGHINDEDWGLSDDDDQGNIAAVRPYQNTLSAVDSRIRYINVDVGYNWLAGADYALSPFVGYSYFRQKMDAFGITRIDFSPPRPDLPRSVVPLKQISTWNALRVGATADLRLTSRLGLSADIAYLPYIDFDGVDVHPLRTEEPSPLSPQWGDGRGVQLEATLTYDVTPQFSVGVGGRYWAMWIPDGENNNFLSGDIQKQRFSAEQAAAFVQASYKFDVPCCAWPFK